MANPHAPAVHMNTRFLVTTKRWFGGGADLNPPIPMRRIRRASTRGCAPPARPTTRPITSGFKRWADDYSSSPTAACTGGVGGIFYDHLECTGAARPSTRTLAFTREVGEAFLDIFRSWCGGGWGTPFHGSGQGAAAGMAGPLAEFNLIYDRGTLFGLKTAGISTPS
jgi:coproporphyrinogen III oxidase